MYLYCCNFWAPPLGISAVLPTQYLNSKNGSDIWKKTNWNTYSSYFETQKEDVLIVSNSILGMLWKGAWMRKP